MHSHTHGHAHGHGHGHGHGHHGDDGASTRKALRLSLWLNGGFLLIEGGVGLATGSLALLSDAVHMLSDVGALLLALLAAEAARRAASAAQTFGLKRAEVLGGFLNGITQLAACGFILWEAVERLRLGPPEVAGLPILIVGVIGLAINLGSAWALYRADRSNLNVRGALLHMLADALGSVGAIVAAGLVLAGMPAADAVVSLLIAALVLWGTWGLLRDTGRVLLQFPPAGLDVDAITKQILAEPGVSSVHDVHAWTLDGARPIISAHVRVRVLSESDAIRRRIAAALADLDVFHLTLQMEADDGACASADCGVARSESH